MLETDKRLSEFRCDDHFHCLVAVFRMHGDVVRSRCSTLVSVGLSLTVVSRNVDQRNDWRRYLVATFVSNFTLLICDNVVFSV